MTPIFLLGITQRSGTNFVHRALLAHPDCVQSAAPPEDHLVSYFQHLVNFLDGVAARWNPRWEPETRRLFMSALRREMANAIVRSLAPPAVGSAFVTKTPSPMGLEHFRTILPEAKLVIVVRDGRDVVASGVRGGFWDFAEGARRWAASAATITQFVERSGWAGPDHIVIRYEDVVESAGHILPEVLKVCGLDSDRYPYDQLSDLPILGSSYSSPEGAHVWKEQPRPADFHPVGRHANFNASELARYEWLCGAEHRRLGYELTSAPRTVKDGVRNRLLDVMWTVDSVRQEIRQLARASVRRVRARY